MLHASSEKRKFSPHIHRDCMSSVRRNGAMLCKPSRCVVNRVTHTARAKSDAIVFLRIFSVKRRCRC